MTLPFTDKCLKFKNHETFVVDVTYNITSAAREMVPFRFVIQYLLRMIMDAHFPPLKARMKVLVIGMLKYFAYQTCPVTR